MTDRLDEQHDDGDVGSRIEAWIEAELAEAPGPRSFRPDVSYGPVDVAVKVDEAIGHGRRLRARRRAAAAGAAATGLVAATVAVVAVAGGPTVTTAPRPPASQTATGRDRPSAPPTPLEATRQGTLAPGPVPVDVAYPSGTGTLTVTWPAPARGTVWRVDRPAVLPADDAARAFRDAVAPSLGARPGTGQVAVYGIGGTPTAYLLAFDVPVGTSTATATLVVSGGGLPDDEVVHDPCGAWPDGVKALGPARPEHPEWCTVSEDADTFGRPTHLVHEDVPAGAGLGPQRSVFTVRPDGLMVSLRFLASAADPRMPDREALDRVVRELSWPGPGMNAVSAVDVRYSDDGVSRTVRWPAPAAGRPWFVPDLDVPAGGPAGPVTEGARDLRRMLLGAVPGASPAPDEGEGVQVLGTADGKATGYEATVSVPGRRGTTETTWTVRATRGGMTVRPVAFDLCGTWPEGFPGLAMSAVERSVWFEDAGSPRRCTLASYDGVTVVHLTVPSAKARGAGDPPPGPAQAYAFTVRPDGTAFAAQVSAPAGSDPAAYLDQLDRLVMELDYPLRS